MQAGRQESKWAGIASSQECRENVHSSSSNIGRGERRRLKLTNGGLNLHTPTFSVCKKINEVEDASCMLLTDRGTEAQDTVQDRVA